MRSEIYFEMIDRNKAREYELKKKDQDNSYTLQELKASHHNFMLDYEIKKIKKIKNKLGGRQ